MKDFSLENRKRVIGGVAVFIVVLYVVRLFALQVMSDDYRKSADSNAFLKKVEFPSRGIIRDRNGKLLVFNQPSYDIMVVMNEERGHLDTLDFCQTLGITKETFIKRMNDIKDPAKNPGYSRFTQQLFMTQVDDKNFSVFREKMFRFPGFYIQKRSIRQYIYPYAAHMLGDVGEVNEADIEDDDYYQPGDYIGKLGLEKYYDGLLLRIPSQDNPAVLGEMIRQDKMFEIFKEHHRWQDLLGISTIGDLNEAVDKGYASGLINLSEALQEKKIAKIAEDIASRKGVRMVLIAGPSSSGKTTSCKRLSIQLLTNGIKPVGISLDDYFVDREKTPHDESGDYDYESLYALNIPLLNQQMNALFKGEEVELPKYNFQTGRSEWSGKRLKLKGNEVLVVEGIHALNPELTADIPNEQIYRVYASALTTILIDTHNYVPTTDNRLLRRIVRDYKYRGVSAQETIRRWPSVRAGENKWIFPFQENADAMFNTAMLFELAVLKSQAEPLLEQVPENVPEHSEAYRLLKFLKYFKPIPFKQVPPTSLLREFLGGSSFKY